MNLLRKCKQKLKLPINKNPRSKESCGGFWSGDVIDRAGKVCARAVPCPADKSPVRGIGYGVQSD